MSELHDFDCSSECCEASPRSLFRLSLPICRAVGCSGLIAGFLSRDMLLSAPSAEGSCFHQDHFIPYLSLRHPHQMIRLGRDTCILCLYARQLERTIPMPEFLWDQLRSLKQLCCSSTLPLPNLATLSPSLLFIP